MPSFAEGSYVLGYLISYSPKRSRHRFWRRWRSTCAARTSTRPMAALGARRLRRAVLLRRCPEPLYEQLRAAPTEALVAWPNRALINPPIAEPESAARAKSWAAPAALNSSA